MRKDAASTIKLGVSALENSTKKMSELTSNKNILVKRDSISKASIHKDKRK